MSCTTKQMYIIMETLTTNQFNKYLNSLEIINECGFSYAQDEVGFICSIDIVNQETEFGECAMIDGVEYELTEEQFETIEKYTYGAIEKEGAEAFNQDDKQHALSLIYS